MAVTSVGLAFAGFTTSGIAAAQATIGNVLAGSALATLQSTGTVGVIAGFCICGAVIFGLAAAIFVGYKLYK